MSHVYHPRAKTTVAIQKEIQESKETVDVLAEKYRLNPKTIQKWKHREDLTDAKMGTKSPRYTLTEEEQTIICHTRRTTLLSFDDFFITLKPTIPKLSHGNLHRCLVRNNLSRLSELIPKEEDEDGTTKKKGKFKNYEIGFVHKVKQRIVLLLMSLWDIRILYRSTCV